MLRSVCGSGSSLRCCALAHARLATPHTQRFPLLYVSLDLFLSRCSRGLRSFAMCAQASLVRIEVFRSEEFRASGTQLVGTCVCSAPLCRPRSKFWFSADIDDKTTSCPYGLRPHCTSAHLVPPEQAQRRHLFVITTVREEHRLQVAACALLRC
jgi:hypothetical protein